MELRIISESDWKGVSCDCSLVAMPHSWQNVQCTGESRGNASPHSSYCWETHVCKQGAEQDDKSASFLPT